MKPYEGLVEAYFTAFQSGGRGINTPRPHWLINEWIVLNNPLGNAKLTIGMLRKVPLKN